jgi:hypothetical protein
MPASTIIVQYRDGSMARHVEVILGFDWGMTSPAYTNDYGEAVVEHSSAGRVEIFVSGRSFGHFQAPGRTAAVTIS